MISAKHIVLTEGKLEELSLMFRTKKVREFSGAPFSSYIRDPEHYDRLAERLRLEFRAKALLARKGHRGKERKSDET